MMEILATLECRPQTAKHICNSGGELIKCSGVSDQGERLINQHGTMWVHSATVDKVIHSDTKGPWWLVHPVDRPHVTRWINAKQDKDLLPVKEKISVLADWKRCKEAVPTIKPMHRERHVVEDEAEMIEMSHKHSMFWTKGGGAKPRPRDPFDYAAMYVSKMFDRDLYGITRMSNPKHSKTGWVVKIGANTEGRKTMNFFYCKFNDCDYNGCCWESLGHALAAKAELAEKVRAAKAAI